MTIHLTWVSALEKVFPCHDPRPYPGGMDKTFFQNETFSLQVAYRGADEPDHALPGLTFQVVCELPVRVRQVRQVPVRFPCFAAHDEGYVNTAPGLYPDLLEEVTPSTWLRPYPRQWQALWLDVEPEGAAPGTYPLTVHCGLTEGETLSTITTMLEVLPGVLPAQRVKVTRWLHLDCLADVYGVPIFSEIHWAYAEAMIRGMVRRGHTMMLTPIHTPPLDTRIGNERPTVQLVDVTVTESGYAFGFDRLDRFIRLCLEAGVQQFEMAHLFTQWGAKAAPKIMGWRNGALVRLFGWDTPAEGDAYQAFLQAYLPALIDHLKVLGVADRCAFHLSDEPSEEALAQYLVLRERVKPLLAGLPIMDAMSDFSFWQQGAMDVPIPAVNHLAPFLEAEVPNLWTYYCVGQHHQVTNTFIAMPMDRTRVLGAQMYKYNLQGFLHWGHNFWYSQFSDGLINPCLTTDADGFAPAGDAHQVYPGANGAVRESLRLMAFHHAMQDLRALQACETAIGREATLALLEEDLAAPLSLTDYPMDGVWLLSLRQRINRAIVAGS